MRALALRMPIMIAFSLFTTIDRPLAAEWSPPSTFRYEDDPPEDGDFPSLSRLPQYSHHEPARVGRVSAADW
jgi:hypothetical protein